MSDPRELIAAARKFEGTVQPYTHKPTLLGALANALEEALGSPAERGMSDKSVAHGMTVIELRAALEDAQPDAEVSEVCT